MNNRSCRAAAPSLALVILTGCGMFQAAPQQFPVYFKANSAELTPEARQAIGQAIARVKAANARHVTIQGQADGTAPSDGQLAIERAKVVEDAFAHAGLTAANGVDVEEMPVLTDTRGVAAHKVLIEVQ